jgi:pyridoxal 5'-phosphate synthase pdxT subunit
MSNTIGILSLQGDVVEHQEHFATLGIECRKVRRAEELEDLAGLVIPGGESTCLFRLMRIFKLDTAIKKRVAAGMKVWGTCAGAILVAAEVVGEGTKLELANIRVQRNAFGSQLQSFKTVAPIPKLGHDAFPLTFIRAPKILEVGNDVEILLQMQDFYAMIETESVLATVFHPELTPCLDIHRYFVEKCGIRIDQEKLETTAEWDMTSWTRFTTKL